MIQSIPYSVFDLPELLALGIQSHKIVSEQYPEEALLVGLLEHLSNALKKAEAAAGSTTREELTEEVDHLDAIRDDIYIGLAKFIEAGLRRVSKPEVQAASRRLMNILNRNGRELHRYGYAKQTAAMESLLEDLSSDQARADLNTIRATDWVKDLKAAHEAFKAVYIQRGKDKASKDILTDEAAHKSLKQALESIYGGINAFFTGGLIEGLEDTIDVLNEAIDRALSSARQSANRKPAQPDGESEES